jgi:AcrR family transcriptional regulator/uncharacterized glyoxalase superfamily protein PhnB
MVRGAEGLWIASNNTPARGTAGRPKVDGMSRPADAHPGRPRASSRETLAEAASELFLERGYAATSVADITRRAGVSRSSFFNYFGSKSDILWGAFDGRLDRAVASLAEGADVRAAVRGIADDLAPDSLALAVANAEAMGIEDELARERAVRHARLAAAVADRLRRDGAVRLDAEVRAAGIAGAVLAAIWQWADTGSGRTALGAILDRALELVPHPAPPPSTHGVRQLRVVVAADDFEAALAFYRDAAGMPQRAAFEAEGGARVAILDAGAATLELANAAQVRFIDGVETEGGASDPIRIGLEVADARADAARLEASGAVLEAAVRETPWRSLNGRLRGPAGLQLTLFQELGPEAEGSDPLA